MKQMPENPSDSLGESSWLHRLPVIAGVLALLLIFGYAFTFKALPAGENPAAWGTFGDYIGGLLNPLISLFTLMVAMQVWKLQKTELLETRKAVEEQGKTAEQQRREQRFFDFLNIYRSTVDSIQFEMESKSGSVISLQGKRAFRLLTTDQHGNPMRDLYSYFSDSELHQFFAHDLTDKKLFFGKTHPRFLIITFELSSQYLGSQNRCLERTAGAIPNCSEPN
jgi:hypothetical protein